MKAYDFLVQCETGLASVTGAPDSPGRVGVSVCDIGAGLNACGAILEALYARERSGRGAGIAVSLFDGMADWMTVPLMHYEHTGAAPARTGLSHAMIAPYGAYPVGDGGQKMVIAIQNEREWTRFCAALLDAPALARDARFDGHAARLANKPALDALIVAAFARHDMESLAAALREARIACGRLNDVAALARHPQLRPPAGRDAPRRGRHRRAAGPPRGPGRERRGRPRRRPGAGRPRPRPPRRVRGAGRPRAYSRANPLKRLLKRET